MATTDSERYVRLTLLTYEGGKWITKHVLVRELGRLPGSPDIITFLGDKKAYLKQKKNRHELTTSQYRLLYPTYGANTNVEDWDLQLLIKIILEFYTTTLNVQEISDLKEILRIRNEVICHTRQPAIDEQEFLANWNELVGCIYSLSTGFDRDIALQARTIIGSFKSGPLSLQDSLEKLAQLCRNDEHMEQVLAGLERIERGQNVVATRVVSIDTKLDDHKSKIDDILDKLEVIQSSLTSAETCKIDIPNLQTQLCISGDREANVKTVEEFVLRTLNAAIAKADDPCDEEMIKCAMKEIIEKIEQQDAVVVSAEKGSILINIKCNSLYGLRKLLTWLKAKHFKTCLKNLEAALERHFESKMDVCLALSNNSILKFLDWSDHCMLDIVNAKSEDLPYKAKVNVGVECLSTEAVSRVVEYLTRGDAANTLNTLSETLSNAFGGRIRVHATLDTGKLLTDLKKVETDLPMLEISSQLTTQTSPEEPGYTDIKTKSKENTSKIYQTLPAFEQDVSSVSLDANEKVETDQLIRETSPQLTTQKSPGEPGYTDIKTSNEENTSKINQAFTTLEHVSKLSLHANVPGVQLSRGRDRNKMGHVRPHLDLLKMQMDLEKMEIDRQMDHEEMQMILAEKRRMDLEEMPMDLEKMRMDRKKRRMDREKRHMDREERRMDKEKRRMDIEKRRLDREKRRLDNEKMRFDREKRRMDWGKMPMDWEKIDLEKQQMDLEKQQKDLMEQQMDLEKQQKDLMKQQKDLVEQQKGLFEQKMYLREQQMGFMEQKMGLKN